MKINLKLLATNFIFRYLHPVILKVLFAITNAENCLRNKKFLSSNGTYLSLDKTWSGISVTLLFIQLPKFQ